MTVRGLLVGEMGFQTVVEPGGGQTDLHYAEVEDEVARTEVLANKVSDCLVSLYRMQFSMQPHVLLWTACSTHFRT